MHRLFKALASEQRLQLLERLMEEDGFVCYCELEDVIDRDRSVLYRHLQKLEAVGLLESRRSGKKVECRLNRKQRLAEILELTERYSQEVNQNES